MAGPFPSFLGNAYDATHMIALAIKKAQSTEGPKLQTALESLGVYDGLVKSYSNPFSASNHEALGPERLPDDGVERDAPGAHRLIVSGAEWGQPWRRSGLAHCPCR